MTRYAYEGGEIIGIEAGPRGPARAHDHTIRHLLASDAGFEVRPSNSLAREARSVEDCRAGVAAVHPEGWRAFDRIPKSGDHLAGDRSWRAPQVADAVREAHDRGYRPRYVTLCRRSRPPGAAGSRWMPSGVGRWSLTVDVYAVHAAWEPTTATLRVVSAYRKNVWTDEQAGTLPGFVANHAGPADPLDAHLRAALKRSGR